MIKHVVMWKFKESADGRSAQENMRIAAARLYALRGVIGELKSMKIYTDISHTDMSMDMMLDTEFDTVEDMKSYAVNPEHKKVSAFIRSVIESRVVLDSEM